MSARIRHAATLTALFTTITITNAARADEPILTVEQVTTLSQSVLATHAPADASRLFIVRRAGDIRLIVNDELRLMPFLDLSDYVNSMRENGLLGLAFHPQYQANGLFFVCYNELGGDIILAEYSVSPNPDFADPNSGVQILRIEHETEIHNGGWIGFGPLGYLYMSVGDGGPGCDRFQHAQDITDELRGKILRLDIDGDDFPADPNRSYAVPLDNPFVGREGDDEIWLYGIRNPWRCSFDRLTGDFWFGDVGQAVREELNILPAGQTRGLNYGWNCREGTACSSVSNCQFPACDCNDPNLTNPILEYSHVNVGCAVVGGYVYRGTAIPDLVGKYVFGDWCGGVFCLEYDGNAVSGFRSLRCHLDPGAGELDTQISGLGEDLEGELYVCDLVHGVYRIIPGTPAVDNDCDANGADDTCELQQADNDMNGNGELDACECASGDFDDDGIVGLSDLARLLSNFGVTPATHADGDFDADGDVDLSDLAKLLVAYGLVCG